MPNYIDKDNLLQLFRDSYCGCRAEIAKGRNELDTAFTGYNSCISLAENIPTADVQEVKRAKWVPNERVYRTLACSNCHRGFCYECAPYEYCYVCGAKMDLEDDK